MAPKEIGAKWVFPDSLALMEYLDHKARLDPKASMVSLDATELMVLLVCPVDQDLQVCLASRVPQERRETRVNQPSVSPVSRERREPRVWTVPLVYPDLLAWTDSLVNAVTVVTADLPDHEGLLVFPEPPEVLASELVDPKEIPEMLDNRDHQDPQDHNPLRGQHPRASSWVHPARPATRAIRVSQENRVPVVSKVNLDVLGHPAFPE